MKCTFLCAILIACSFPVFSQFKKGDMIIGTYVGNTGFSSSKSNSSYTTTPITYSGKSKSFSIGIGPEIGWFVTDNLVVGSSISLSFYSSRSENSSSGTTTVATSKGNSVYFSAGPSARLYLGKSNEKGRPFVWLGGGLGFYPSDDSRVYNTPTTYDYKYKTKNYFNWNIGPRVGYEHLLNKHIGLQYYIGYTHGETKFKYVYDYTTGGTDYTYTYKYSSNGVNFGVGVLVHLEKKRK